MASTTGPSTPDRTPRNTNLNRSFTVPSKLATTSSSANRTAEIGATEGIETLYVHPNARVVKFAVSSKGLKTKSDQGELGAGALSWTSPTEQTIANGPMEIYRVPGSVSFLRSGSLLHTMMPRSQCWCVDGTSKFAMTVPVADTYYRIDLPGETPEDLERVQSLEVTLTKVLRYERTACPFARGFSVELPEQPQVHKSRKRTHGPAKKWRLDRAYSWKPEDGGERPRPEDEDDYGSTSGSEEDVDNSNDDVRSDASGLIDEVRNLNVVTPSRPSVKERIAGLTALRSVTAPPQFNLHHTPPTRLRTAIATSGAQESNSAETAVEQDPSNLRTFQTIPTAMPPSPPDSSAGFDSSEAGSSRIEHALQAFADPAAGDGHQGIAQDGLDDCNAPPACVPQIRDSGQVEPTRISESDATQPTSAADLAPSSATQPPVIAVAGDPLVQPEAKADADQSIDWDARSVVLPNLSSSAEIGAAPNNILPSVTASTYPAAVSSNYETSQDFSASDPFAQIQARIQARRSIGGMTAIFPIRHPSSSSSGESTASAKSSLSRRSQQQQQAFATALVRKAVSTFLGPPAALVAIMLRIAARFANGRFAVDLGFDRTPVTASAGSRYVPGSFDLDGSDVEDLSADPDGDDWGEDDFGVPIRSPVRLASINEARNGHAGSRERSGWDVD